MSDKQNKNHSIIFDTVIPIILFIAFTITVSVASYYFVKPDEKDFALEYNSIRHIVYPAVITSLFALFYIRTQTLYSSFQHESYISHKSPKFVWFLIKNINFWLEIIAFSVIWLAFDISKVFPFIYNGFLTENDFAEKAKLFVYILPIFMLISIIARGLAVLKWNSGKRKNLFQGFGKPNGVSEKERKVAVNPNRLIPTPHTLGTARYFSYSYSGENPALSATDEFVADYSPKAKRQAFLLLMAVFVFFIIAGDFIIGTVLATLVPFFIMLAKPPIMIAIAVIILSIPLIRRIKAIFTRISFTSKLKRLCKENKYKLSKIVSPIRSLFFKHNGENFNITVKQKTYSCKLIGVKKASLPILLSPDGTGEILHAFVFAGIKWFQYSKSFDFGYESKYKKVLIINPLSKFVYTAENGSLLELDNGDRVGDYYIYTAQGFLNSADRDCIETKEKKKC